jgi:putative transferase (TIGR04331 family)
MKFHLVNTPLGFLSAKEPILLSGMWSSRNDKYIHLKDLEKLEVAKYHWDNKEKFSRDYVYLSQLTEEILHLLAEKLNQIHKVDFSIRFWRILLKPWLNTFLPSVFDRWETINNCLKSYEIESASIFKFNLNDVTPNSTAEFNSFYNLEDFWNEYIYSEILKYVNDNKLALYEENGEKKFTNITDLVSYSEERSCMNDASNFLFLKIKLNLKQAIYKLFELTNKFKRPDTIFFHDCVDKKDQFVIEAKLGNIPSLFTSKKIPVFEFDKNKREDLFLSSSSNSDFKNFLITILGTQLPKIFVEGFNFLLDDGYKAWPAKPKSIICSGSVYADDYFKFYLANQVTVNNSKLFILQHGGHYGIGRLSCMLDYELQIANKFISWGWGQKSNQIDNIPSLKISKMIKSSRYSKKGSLLIIAQDYTRYSYHLFSYPVASQYISYENDIKNFIKSLNKDIYKASILRFKHGGSYGWNEIDEFKSSFPELILDDGVEKLESKIAASRLCIQTANFTTYLESLALNIPTVIFWDPFNNELTEEASKYFEDLKKSGIFFPNPYDAAKHVNNIWDDVEKWWNTAEVQKSRLNFISKYALSSDKYIDDFASYLKENI